MNAMTYTSSLRDTLGIKKETIALKRMKDEPSTIEDYEGRNTLCFMMQEALEGNKVFYTTLRNRMCLFCTATGMALTPYDELSNEKLKENLSFAVEAINTFQDVETAFAAEKEAAAIFPKFEELCSAVVVGPTEKVPDPDVVIISLNPDQANLLTRAYCYVTGTFIKGYAGIGACRMIFPDAFIHKEPTFTVSDRSWRIALKLAPDELTLVTPPDKLMMMLENLERSKVGGPTPEAFETMPILR